LTLLQNLIENLSTMLLSLIEITFLHCFSLGLSYSLYFRPRLSPCFRGWLLVFLFKSRFSPYLQRLLFLTEIILLHCFCLGLSLCIFFTKVVSLFLFFTRIFSLSLFLSMVVSVSRVGSLPSCFCQGFSSFLVFAQSFLHVPGDYSLPSCLN
jgi:hypothetical protein